MIYTIDYNPRHRITAICLNFIMTITLMYSTTSIYAQWIPEGFRPANDPENSTFQFNLIPDVEGGFYVAYTLGYSTARVQHVDSLGNRLWGWWDR